MSSERSKRPRIIGALLLVLVSALGLLWRLPASPVEWNFIECDNDSLFQLHRIARALPHYPSVPAFDAFSHYPHGFRVHWPAPHAFFYASAVRLAGLDRGSLAEIGGFVSWIPPILGATGLALVALLAHHYDARWRVAWWSALLAAVSGEMVRPFFFGTIDHHLFAQLGVMIAVLGRLRRRAWLWACGLFLLCAMTTEAVLYVSILLVVLGAAEAAAAPTSTPAPARWFLVPALAGLAGWAADRWLEAQPLPLDSWSWEYPTLFQPAWYGVLGVSLLAARRYLGRDAARPSAARFVVAALGVGAMLALFLQGSGALETIATRLLGANRMYVGEEASVFRRGFFSAHPWYQVLAAAGVYAFWRTARAWRRAEGADAAFAWGMVVAGSLFAFAEVRHMYIFAALQIVGFTAAAFAAGDGLARLVPQRSRNPVALAVVLLLSLPLLTSTDVTNRAGARRGACAALPQVEDVVAWLRGHTPSPGGEEDSPVYGLFTPWNLGHQIHVLAQRPVVIDPFNHADEEGDWVGEVAERVWLAESGADFVATLRGLRVRYLLLVNPAEEIVGALRRRGEAGRDAYRIEPDGSTTFLPGMSRFAAFRLFLWPQTSAEVPGLELRYESREREEYTKSAAGGRERVSVSSLRVYELVEPR